MIKYTLLVENELGLHARAAAKLVRVATGFASQVYLAREGVTQQIDSKSILGILMLAASKGTRLEVSIEGQDEAAAWQAISNLFADKFGEPN
jgi:phosphocarrier protein HPr